MAGRGPAPKPAERRARANKDPHALKVVTAPPVPQPELPSRRISNLDLPWPEQTVAWWQMWGESPLSADFTASDWSELMDTAWLHAALWSGDTKAAAELRLRVAKFGATPEDRARLRITFAAADEADGKRATPKPSATRQRRGPLKAV